MNWDVFIAGMCMMSMFFNITENTSIYSNYENIDIDSNMQIYNIIIFIVIMIISTIRAVLG